MATTLLTPTLAFVNHDTEITVRPPSWEAVNTGFALLDIRSGKISREVQGPRPGAQVPTNWATNLVSSPDESVLAVIFGSAEHQPLALYSTKYWSKLADIPGPAPVDLRDEPSAVAFSPDGHLLADATSLDVMVYDLVAGRVILRFPAFTLEEHGCCISGVAFSPDSKEIAVATHAHPSSGAGGKRTTPPAPVRIFRVADGALVAAYPPTAWRVNHVAWDRAGRFTAFLTDETLYLWNPAIPGLGRAIPIPGLANSFSLAPDGRKLALGKRDCVAVFAIDD